MKLCECGCGTPAPIAKVTDNKKGWTRGQPKRFVAGHNTRLRPKTEVPAEPIGMRDSQYHIEDLPVRLAAKILINPASGCWEWRRVRRSGYGRVKWNGRLEEAHRVIYTLFMGPIPDGLEIDHVQDRGCISRACCWPAHLEAVTPLENNRRRAYVNKPACSNGHEWTSESTGFNANGSRYCRICKHEQSREWRLQNPDRARANHREYMRAYRKRRVA